MLIRSKKKKFWYCRILLVGVIHSTLWRVSIEIRCAKSNAIYLGPIGGCNIDTISFCNGLHLSIKDVTEIVILLILVLKLIAKLRKCIKYFRSGGQTVVRSNVTCGDGTTNNQMGTYQTSECWWQLYCSLCWSFYFCRKMVFMHKILFLTILLRTPRCLG